MDTHSHTHTGWYIDTHNHSQTHTGTHLLTYTHNCTHTYTGCRNSEPIAGQIGLFSLLLFCSPYTLYTVSFNLLDILIRQCPAWLAVSTPLYIYYVTIMLMHLHVYITTRPTLQTDHSHFLWPQTNIQNSSSDWPTIILSVPISYPYPSCSLSCM